MTLVRAVPLLSVLLLSSAGLSADAPSPAAVRWEKSFSAALKKAKAEKKPVMIDFWAEWCGWCHELDRTTYRDADVVALSKRFVAVKVDTEGSRAEARIAADYRVESLPTIAFVSPHGRLLLRVDGFQPAASFVPLLERALKTAEDVLGWETALAADPADVAAQAKLGAHMFDAQFYEESRTLLSQAAAADRERPTKERKRTRTLLGVIHHFADKPAEAEKTLKQALDLEPPDAEEDAAALYALGRTYVKWGKPKEARVALQKVVDAYPQSRPAARARDTLAGLGTK